MGRTCIPLMTAAKLRIWSWWVRRTRLGLVGLWRSPEMAVELPSGHLVNTLDKTVNLDRSEFLDEQHKSCQHTSLYNTKIDNDLSEETLRILLFIVTINAYLFV